MGKREQFGAAGIFALICLLSGSAMWVGAALLARPHAKGVGAVIAQDQVVKNFAISPALFVENRGQCGDPSVRFAHQGRGAVALIGDDGICLQLSATEDTEGTENRKLGNNSETRRKTETVWMRFVGANKVRPVGEGLAETRFNYHIGADPTKWIDGAPCYERVVYKNLYPGIDLVVRGLNSNLKYEFHVAAGADYKRIQIHYDGIDQLRMNANGTLEARLTDGTSSVVDGKPVAHQEIDGRRKAVEMRFGLINSSTCVFEAVDALSPDHELIVDPDLVWSTYLGGTSYDEGDGIATDRAGNCYVTGYTESSTWVGHGTTGDAYVVKLTSAGHLLWATFLGGSFYDVGFAVATDESGNCFVTGQTYSPGWVRGECDSSYNGGGDAFVAKLNRSGHVLWSSYLGGRGFEWGRGVATDASGNCYVSGTTCSRGWVRRGFDTTFNGGYDDAFVAKLSSRGRLMWSTYLGGDSYDAGRGVATDASGNCYVSGTTCSRGWVRRGFDTTFNGGDDDAFVAKLSSTGRLMWSTYLGGSSVDWGAGVATDGSGNCYVTGGTWSSGWVSGGFDTSINGEGDAFVAKVASDGAHLWSTYLGGTEDDGGYGVATDAAGDCYVTGYTHSDGWVSGGFDTSINGESDAYVVKLAGDGAHLWSTYLGGRYYDDGRSVASDRFGNCYVTGDTTSPRWVWGGYDTSFNGHWHAFISRIGTGCMLRVQSEPWSGVNVTGTPAGKTNYAHKCDHGSLVSLKAAATAAHQYVFTQWIVNGRRQHYGMTGLSFTIRQGSTAVAMYKRFGILRIRGPHTVSGGGSAQYRCHLYCDDGSVYNITKYATWLEDSPHASFTKPGYLETTSVSSEQLVRIMVHYAGRTKIKYVTITP